jgi:hypothetical protein
MRKTIMTTINDYNITSNINTTIYNDDKKEISTIDNRINTCNSMDYNQTMTRKGELFILRKIQRMHLKEKNYARTLKIEMS